RLPLYFAAVDTSADGSGKFAYMGLEYGLTAAAPYQSVSHWSDQMFDPSFPSVLIDYVEVQFLLAEAAARGWTTPMTAQEHYEAGITASIVAWGGDAAEAASYIAQANVAYDQNRWKELIGTQKWIALYNRGNEGYASWRMLDWPVLDPPEDMTQADIPLRWPYPFNEKDLNLENYNAAASAIGGDDVRTQLFWDVTPNSDNPPAR
ncbi:MAG: SusD/RagB family nutrient-binding outer membrane lipoprotein, partial [Bacteroidetes bacterium]